METNPNNQRLLETQARLVAHQVKLRLDKSETEFGEHNRGGYRLFNPEAKKTLARILD